MSSFTSKENEVNDPFTAMRNKQSQQNKARPEGSHRTALGSKSLNTDSQSFTIERNGANIAKRAPSYGSSAQLDETKRRKRTNFLQLNEPSPPPRDEDNQDEEETDEDDEQMHNSAATSTPLSNLHARRSISRQKAVYPRLNLADMKHLDIDEPATNKEEVSNGDDEDMDAFLTELKLTSPQRLAPPRITPQFMEKVAENMNIGLDDFPDLSSDDGSDSLSTIELATPRSLHNRAYDISPRTQ